MSAQGVVRSLYPQILSISPEDIDRLSGGDPDVHAYLLRIYQDLTRTRSRSEFEGWFALDNPFASMDFARPCPPTFTQVMQTQYEMTLRGNEWLDVGMWILAEEYYRIAVSLAFASNDVVAALQNGLNLALCYLGGGDCTYALHLTGQLIPVVAETPVYGLETFRQGATTAHLCLLKRGEPDRVASRIQSAIPFYSPGDLQPDESVFRILADVYQTTGDSEALRSHQQVWRQLRQIIDSLL